MSHVPDRTTDSVWVTHAGWTEVLKGELAGFVGAGGRLHYDKITELDLSGYPVRSLEPLLQMRALEVVHISGTQVTDLSPLATLPRLQELHATFCKLNLMKGWEGLTGLRVLDISYPVDPPADLTWVPQLHLHEFYCNACELSSPEILMQLGRLEVLSLHFNPIPKHKLIQLARALPQCHILC
ncbi:MAG: hypothetical protein SF053_07585 [Bacteroidia bacterium]|nr:hypothetical protein [Bacteroidia bacterium]